MDSDGDDLLELKLEKISEVDRLLRDNRTQIDKLKDLCKDIIESEIHDDIYLLRFVLSNKTAESSIEPLRFTINWRKTKTSVLSSIKKGGSIPYSNVINQFQVASKHKWTIQGEPLFIARIGLCNPKGLMDAVSEEDILTASILLREEVFNYCDTETRRQGKIIRCMCILDFRGFSLTKNTDSRYNKIINQSSKLSEKMYPQLLDKVVILNAPKVFNVIFNLIKPLVSNRTVDKLLVCKGDSLKDDLNDCPFLFKFIRFEDLPTFLGGKCTCVNGCIGNISNSQTVPIRNINSDGKISLHISSRQIETIEIPIQSSSNINYSFQIEKMNIKLSMYIKPILEEEEEEEGFKSPGTIMKRRTSASWMHYLLEPRVLDVTDGEITGKLTSPIDGNWKSVLFCERCVLDMRLYLHLLYI